jgi:hypothetical protein
MMEAGARFAEKHPDECLKCSGEFAGAEPTQLAGQ